MKARLIMLVLVLALAAFTAAGCGDDEDSGSGSQDAAGETTGVPENQAPEKTNEAPVGGDEGAGGGGTELKIAADPGGALKFDKDKLDAKAGKVTIVMDNPSPLPHAVSIEGDNVAVDGNVVKKGGKSTVEADLEAGEYSFYCPVAGHEEGGMKGLLTVE